MEIINEEVFVKGIHIEEIKFGECFRKINDGKIYMKIDACRHFSRRYTSIDRAYVSLEKGYTGIVQENKIVYPVKIKAVIIKGNK